MKLMIDISAEDFEKVKCGRGAVSMMRKAIIHGITLPSVEPERKPGIWTHEDTGVWICGVCGEEVGEMGDEYGVPKYNFCPYCGADMTGRR